MTSADAVWAQYCAAHPEFADRPTPGTDQFAYSPQLCDERVQLVLDGVKRATADLLAEYGASDRGFPGPGDHWIALDGSGVPRVVLRTTVTRIGELETVEEVFAFDDGDGGRTREGWLTEHRERFADTLPEDSQGLEREPVVFERFALVWPQDRVTEADRAWLAMLDGPR